MPEKFPVRVFPYVHIRKDNGIELQSLGKLKFHKDNAALRELLVIFHHMRQVFTELPGHHVDARPVLTNDGCETLCPGVFGYDVFKFFNVLLMISKGKDLRLDALSLNRICLYTYLLWKEPRKQRGYLR